MNTKANLLNTKKNLVHFYAPCYTINRILTPFPEQAINRIKPPAYKNLSETSENLEFLDIQISEEEKIQKSIEKAERIVTNNFYLGGSPYTVGAMDYLYKGVDVFNGKRAA